MTMIVGYAPDKQGVGALHLGALLARSAGDELVVCSVVPAPWTPGMARVDAEYRAYLDSAADQALEIARQQMPDGVAAQFLRHSARSAPAGLLEVAAQHDATMLVLGSSSAGFFGHVALGSVTDRLVHSSPVSLAFAPRGFRTREGTRVSRVTAAFGGGHSAENLVVAAASVAAQVEAGLRIASFAVWSRPPYTMQLGTDTEEAVLTEWSKTMQESVEKALSQVESLSVAPQSVETVIGRGATWSEAIDDMPWEEGDIVVVGSSALAPVASVFLGTRATKILRHSPVPVAVVPRARAKELAGRAVNP
jgi:nucleotide-binding universal stress UspA family protein